MSYILHIETATDICSVAISKMDKLISIQEEKNSLKHSEIITLQIEEVIKSAGIDKNVLSAVSLSEGPGSYTSLRVGMSAAKAICFALNIPLIGINTLESLFTATVKKDMGNLLYCPMIDARRMEVYASLFVNETISIFENKPVILDENTFDIYIKDENRIVFSGNGSIKAKEKYKSSKFIFTDTLCSAKNLIKPAYKKYKIGDFADLTYFSPNYIKPPNITKPKVKQL